MARNKRKSKALLITFFVMIILLFLFYILAVKNNPTNTKGTSSENRGFFSLFSGSKDKNLDTIDNTANDQVNGDTNTGDIAGSNSDTNNNNQGGTNIGDITPGSTTPGINTGDITPGYNPKLFPLPRPDVIDPNDINLPPVDTTPNPDLSPLPEPDVDNTKQCNLDDYKLKFTDAEQAELDKLLRDFYRIAVSIKTEEDIDIEHEAAQSYRELVDEAKDLTNQCYEETSNPSYTKNIDYTQSISQTDSTPDGIWISENFSALNESRIERKPNPWYQFDSSVGGYYYQGDIIARSERFQVAGYEGHKIGGQAYYNGSFNSNYDALSRCLLEAKIKAAQEKAKLPSGYSVSYKCNILDGTTSTSFTIKPATSNIYKVRYPIYQESVWYPNSNKTNTTNSNIEPKEWYYSELSCLKRDPSGCTLKYSKNETFTKIPPIEWAYSITTRSPNFGSIEECNNAIKKYGHKNASCNSGQSENAYIQKIWNDKLVDNSQLYGYVSPINYHIFENIFYIW